MHQHTRRMTEVFEALAVIGDAVLEDRVVHLLASLPDSYDMLVTALKIQSEMVPKRELVTERVIHEKLKEKAGSPHSRQRWRVHLKQVRKVSDR